MKLTRTYSIILVLLVALATGIQSCKKESFNVNKNPNQPTDSTVTYNVLLPAALQSTSYIVATDWGFLQNWLGYWARSGTYAPNVTEETYQITTNFQTNIWDDLYSNAFNYDIMQSKARQAGATFYEGVARIMKAHNFQILVDVYNNVPYFDALKGNANPTPKYDKGIDIYKDLFRQLDTAIILLGETNPDVNVDYETNDLVYGGDVNMWIKLANTLKLRMLVHVYGVSDFDIAGEVAKIDDTGLGYLGSGESAMINPGFGSTKPNPFYRTYVRDETATATGSSVYYKANSYAVGDATGALETYGWYRWDGDPRMSRFYVAGNQGMRGVAYGLPPVSDNAAATLSAVSGPGLLPNGAASDAWIFTSVESMFLQAEAAERGIIAGDAGELTVAAVTESFVWLGLDAGSAQAYLEGNATYPDVDYYADGGGLNTIICQKWFALNALAPFEVWSDYRRVPYEGNTHFVYGAPGGYTPGPAISVAPQNTATEIPVRLLYPQNEYNYNAANVGGEGTIDQFNSKIFWDNN